MVRMGFLVAMIHFLVVMLWFIKAGRGTIAKDGCIDTCGLGVRIPYPFGIGPNCYANQSYAVTCNGSSAFLASLNLQILSFDIGLRHTLQVRNHIDLTHMNLLGTPFSFSSRNLLVGVGCNIEAQLLSHTRAEIVAQCTAICNNATGGGSDTKFCHTNVPPFLKAFNISLSTTNNSSRVNKYGFLVDNDWFIQSGLTYHVESRPQVPVNLIWKTDEMCYGIMADNFTSTRYPSFSDEYAGCFCGWPAGNPYLQNGCPTGSSHRITKFVFVGIGSGLGILFVIMGGWWLRKFIKRRNKAKLKKNFFKRNGGLLLQKQLCSAEQVYVEKTKLFSSKELETATDYYNENRVLGRGGQGTVYKGMLTDGKIVAVKKSKIVDEGKLDEFINEVVILSQINHRNVVKLHGCCLETEVPLLVYDFIPNGTLFQYIHYQENVDFPLIWDVRLRIACEVAGALSYLHSAASLPIYHRDIKSSNILLDDKYRAKVADFGTSRLAPVDQTHMTTRVQGTFGYLDPEYYQSSQFTAKSDVYSFGVVLVELLTGQKAIMPITFMEGRSLATYFMLSMKEKRLFDIVDAQVLKEGRKEIVSVANLANRCLNLNGRERPTMKEVSTELEAIKNTHAGSPQFQVHEHNEEVDDYGIIQLAGPFDSTASTSITSLVGR